MQFYNISEKGDISKTDNLGMGKNDVHLVDDEKTIFLWFGQKVQQSRKDMATKRANELNSKRSVKAKVVAVLQNQESTAFKAAIDKSKDKSKGESAPAKTKVPSKIEATLATIKRTPELEEQIQKSAYLLSEKGLSYDDLCWVHAEDILKITLGTQKLPKAEVENKSAEINGLHLTIEDLHYRIAELKVLIEKKVFKI